MRAVDRRVVDDAARDRACRCCSRRSKSTPRRGGDLRQIVVRRLHGGEAARPFDAALAGGEARLRQQRRRVAVLRRAAGMKRLAHRAEHLAQPGRLRGRQADRPHHLLLVKPEQLADRGRRAEHAGGAGDVPADIVVRGIDRVADARLGLEAEDERVDESRPLTGCALA